MLTVSQKNAIMADIKSLSITGYTVNDGTYSRVFNPTTIYDNQLTEKPNFTNGVITLKYIIQNVSKISDSNVYNEYKIASLSINVYAKLYENLPTKISGAVISQDIARQLINHIRSYWVSGLLDTYKIQILTAGDAQDLTDLVLSNRNLKESIYRTQLDVKFMYRILQA